MKNKGLFIIALLTALILKAYISSSQDTVRLSVHFDYGKAELLPGVMNTLDSLVATLHGRQASRMRIVGNTDAHGSHLYNLDLSDSRARAVYDYLCRKGLLVDELEILGQGKALPLFPGLDEASRAGNRRTDIEIAMLPPEKTWAQLRKEDSLVSWNDNSAKDITYANGIRLIIPEGVLAGYTNGSLQFRPECSLDMDKLYKQGFTTMSSDGQALASAGVFSLNLLHRSGREIPCNQIFNYALEAWVPVTNCSCLPANVVLWDSLTDDNGNIVWLKNADSIRIERIGLQKYYVFPVRNMASLNLDCPRPAKALELAFRHFQPVSVKLVYTRTKAITMGLPKGTSGMTVPLLTGKEDPKVYAIAVDQDQNTYRVNGKRLSKLKQNPLNKRVIVKKQDFRKANALKIKKVNKTEVIFGYNFPDEFLRDSGIRQITSDNN